MLGYAGHNTGGQETAARLDFLRKVFDVSDSVPASLLAGCVNSLLGVDGQDDTFQFMRNCTTWWHDDNEDFTRQLHNLLRGMQHAYFQHVLEGAICASHALGHDLYGAHKARRLYSLSDKP